MHDRYVIPLIIFGTLVLVMLVFVIVSFLIIHRQRLRQHELAKGEITYRYQNQLLKTRLELEELALKSVSREIHDHVNQVLGVVRMNLFHILKAGTPEEVNRYIQETNVMVKDTIDHLRDLSHTLSGSGVKKMGLVNSIRKEAGNISRQTNIAFNIRCEEDDLPLAGEQEILIFRIIQESLSNIVKHAQATQVIVAIVCEHNSLHLEVCDNGNGFEPTPRAAGIGLVNMHERATILNGKLNVSSVPGRGCTVSLYLDLPDSRINLKEYGTPGNDKNCDY